MRTAPINARAGDGSRGVGAVLLALDAWTWAPLAGAPLFSWSLATLRPIAEVREVVIVASSERFAAAGKLLAAVPTAVRRHYIDLQAASEKGVLNTHMAITSAFSALGPDVEVVLLYDMACPLLRPEAVRGVLAATKPGTIALATEPVKDTVKVVRERHIEGTLPRERLAHAHAPLAACRGDLSTVLGCADRMPLSTPPPSRRQDWLPALVPHVPRAGLRLAAVPGHGETLRVASREDVAVAERLLLARSAHLNHTPGA